MRTSFILHLDSLCILDKMTDEQAGKLVKAIYQFQKTKELPELDLLLSVAITPFINQFFRDEKLYEMRAERSRENGKSGGRPLKVRKKNPENPAGFLETQKTQKNPVGPRKPDSVSKSDSVSDSVFKIQWDRWVVFRKEKGKTLTASTAEAQKKFLAGFPEETACRIIEQSILNGWVGLFEIKNTPNGSNANQKPSTSKAERNAAGVNYLLNSLRSDIEAHGGGTANSAS